MLKVLRSTWQRRQLSAITHSVASRIVIATSFDHIIRMDWQSSSEEMLSRLDRGEGSVLCGDTSIILWRAFVESGYDASIISFGFVPNLTHNAVLVRVDGRHYYYDAFFDFEFAQSFETAIDRYKATGSLELNRGPTNGRRLLSPDRRHEHFSLEGFVANPHNQWNWSGMTRIGFAPSAENLFLFPFAVFNGEHLYVDDPDKSPMLAYLISVTGCRGAERKDAIGFCKTSGLHPSLLSPALAVP